MPNRKLFAIAIVGPTASGKSALALALSRKLDGEIVSCDSMQIYRRMDVGTAKPTREERREVAHHLIDIRDSNEPYSAGDYAADAQAAVSEIVARGKVPIFCGGTGLYLEAAVTGRHGEAPSSDPAVRDALQKACESEEGRLALYRELSEVDPESAAMTHPNNVRRLVRAMEIYRISGRTKTDFDRESREREDPIGALTFCVGFDDRSELYRRIDLRVDRMMEAGLEGEARALYDDGFLTADTTAGQAIGYRQFLPYFAGEGSLPDVVEEIKQASRRYAKRQISWFKPKGYLPLDGATGVSGMTDAALPAIERFLSESRK